VAKLNLESESWLYFWFFNSSTYYFKSWFSFSNLWFIS